MSVYTVLSKLHNDFEEVLATLQEVYHYTDTHNLKKILHDGKFRLASPVSGESDKNHVNKPYFLSTSRSKIGHYTKKNHSGAVLNLNLDHLQHHHKTSQVDYWGPAFRKHNPTGNEMEERVHSDKPHIKIPKPATKLVKAIHVLHPKPEKYDSAKTIAIRNENLRHSMISAKKHKIPIHVYDNKQHWLHQRTEKAIPVSKLDLKGTNEKWHSNEDRNAKRDIHPYLKLYHSKPYRPEYGTPEQRIVRSGYINDIHTHLEHTLHNNRKSPVAHKLTELVHKHGGIKPFIKHLQDKHSEANK